MKYYDCRHIRPEPSSPATVDGHSPEDAAQEFHMSCRKGVRLRDGSGAIFSIIAVDGIEFISRIFYLGIGRKGGVKPPKLPLEADSLEEVAEKLGCDVGDLAGEWIGDEKEWR